MSQTPLPPGDRAGSHRPKSRHHRRSFLRRARHMLTRANRPTLLIATLATIAIIVIVVLILITDAQNRIQSSWATLARIVKSINAVSDTELTLTDFQRLRLAVTDFHGALTTAQRQTAILRPIATLDPGQASTFLLLDSASELSLAADDILAGLEPVLFFLASSSPDESVTLQISSGERIVDLLRLGRQRFESAQQHLATAQDGLGSLVLDTLPADTLIQAQQAATYLNQLSTINEVLLDAPNLLTRALGLDEDQIYLVLAQNNDEIRPSGGYLSTYGWMQVHDGRVVDYAYYPTTPASPTPPPASMADEISIPEWWFQFDDPIYAAWDGSWYADFPATAAMAAWYYNAGGNENAPVDGVIAIDITGFEYLLEGLGSVTVAEYEEEVTPETFRQVVYAIRAGQDDEERLLQHKQFLAALYRQIMADWQTIGRERGPALISAALRALQEKHIMFYFTDDQLNRAVQALGWGGTQQAAAGHDYLMVVDANLGNKSNSSISRQIIYDVDLQPDGTAVGNLTLVYDYSASVAERDPAVNPAHYGRLDYFNLLQVFTPAGSTLLNSDDLWNTPESETTGALTDFVALTLVAYNTTESFSLSYATPPVVEAFGGYRRYRLLVQKQPGTRADPLTVQISLPAGAKLVSTSPEAAATYEIAQKVLEFRASLVTDQWIEVVYRLE